MKKHGSKILVSVFVAMMLAATLAAPAPALAAEARVLLHTAEDFAVLAYSTITNTGPTTISGDISGAPRGDVGLYPKTSITGRTSIKQYNGEYYIADAVALQAQNDLTIAYTDAAGRTVDSTIATELGGQTLTSGVYNSEDTTFQITGTLILDGENNPDSVFIFQMGSSLTTASGSKVVLINGARFCRVFWQVGSSATLGTNSTFVGHILAMASITATTGAKIYGQLLARNGAVTLDTNTIINGFCGFPTVSTPIGGATQVAVYPPLGGVGGSTISPLSPTNLPTNLPPTGDNTTGKSSLGIAATGIGVAFVLAGISLYLFKRRKAKS